MPFERQLDGSAPQPGHTRVALHAVTCDYTGIAAADTSEVLGSPEQLVSVIDPSHAQGTSVHTDPCCATNTCAPVSFGTCAHDFEAVFASVCIKLFMLARPCPRAIPITLLLTFVSHGTKAWRRHLAHPCRRCLRTCTHGVRARASCADDTATLTQGCFQQPTPPEKTALSKPSTTHQHSPTLTHRQHHRPHRGLRPSFR